MWSPSDHTTEAPAPKNGQRSHNDTWLFTANNAGDAQWQMTFTNILVVMVELEK